MTDEIKKKAKKEADDASEDLVRALLRVAKVSVDLGHYLTLVEELAIPMYALAHSGMTADQVIEKFRQLEMATQEPGGES